MNNTLIATLGGLWALLLWGTSDWLASKSSRQLSAYAVNLAIQLPGTIIWPLMLLITSQSLPGLKDSLILSAAGLSFTVAYLSFVKALAKGHVGIVVPISSTYPIITIILTVLFLSSVFSGLQYLAMFVIVAGIMLLAYERNIEKIPLRTLHRETALALIAGLFWGIGNFLQNIVVGRENWLPIVTVINISMYAALLIFTFIASRDDLKQFKKAITNKAGFAAGCFLSLGSIGFYIGATRAKSVLIPSVISAATPLVASSLSVIYDKEKLGFYKRLGAIVVVIGIIMLNVL